MCLPARLPACLPRAPCLPACLLLRCVYGAHICVIETEFVYSKLFDYLIVRINEALLGKTGKTTKRVIGILVTPPSAPCLGCCESSTFDMM